MKDLYFDRTTKDFDGTYVTGVDALAQRVWFRLSRLVGEWFLDLASGLPEDVFSRKPPALENLRAQIRAQIMDVSGVIDVPTLTLDLDTATRRLSVTTRIKGADGTLEVTV